MNYFKSLVYLIILLLAYVVCVSMVKADREVEKFGKVLDLRDIQEQDVYSLVSANQGK